MNIDVSITLLPEQENNQKIIRQEIFKALKKNKEIIEEENIKWSLIKRSVDARHNKVKIILRYNVTSGKDSNLNTTFTPSWKNAGEEKKVIIIGSGPAGLFGALKLLEYGIKPIIVERGERTQERKRSIAKISTQGNVLEDSNYCFGEGGAGTFSDGKLYTRSNKRGDIPRILQIFSYFGADKKICTDSHPHIGTDKLPQIINSICEKISSLGGELYFNSRCIDFITEDKDKTKIIKGIVIKDTLTGKESSLKADAVLLATGHSANDIYKLIAKKAPEALEAKTFAVGVRVEHPRALIDSIQYHGKEENLGAAEYRFTTQQDGRGVYSFCMCPGGFVVPSSTEPDSLLVNGMSSARRNSKWSNAAVVVEIRPEDIPEEFVNKAIELGSKDLAGLLWRTWLEKETFIHGEGQKAPSQIITDFINKKESSSLPATSYAPGIVPSRLDEWLPLQISNRLSKCFKDVDKKMKGYVCDRAVLIATETRTSTPVRILRNKESGECTFLRRLYPAGEGSGYAGGIVSSAMDGENQCEKIARLLTSQ